MTLKKKEKRKKDKVTGVGRLRTPQGAVSLDCFYFVVFILILRDL